jgi:hypothetical protein
MLGGRSLSLNPTHWQDPNAGRGLVDGDNGALLKSVCMCAEDLKDVIADRLR